MASAPRGQFRIEMPDGLIIERLPIGFANRQWRLCFVTSGAKSIWEIWADRQGTRQGSDPFRERIDVEGMGGDIDVRSAGSGGSADEQEYALSFRSDHNTTGVKITYRHNGELVGEEELGLPRSLQDG